MSAAEYPQLQLRDTTSDALLRRLEWTVLRRLDGLIHGHHRTVLRGAGLDLSDLREYQPHDDVRHIDWNVTARLQQPYVRQYTEDRDVTAWFLLDLSGSVDFGTQRSKRDTSIAFVTVLARLLTQHGNKVGAVLYGNRVDGVVPPRTGRSHVLHLLERMRNHRPAPSTSPTHLDELLRGALPALRRRCTVFVVSDFISEPGWTEALGLVGMRHDVVAVRLYDPLEMAMPDLGIMTIQDAETGEQLLVDTHDPAFRSRFDSLAARQEAELHESLLRAGVDTLELATDDDLGQSILRFIDLRRQRQRQRAPARWPARGATPTPLPQGAHA